MYDFSTLISLLIGITGIFIPLYFTLKKELDDLNVDKIHNSFKIENRIKLIKRIKLMFVLMVITVIIFFRFPFYYEVLSNINNFINSTAFRISFICGSILIVIIEFFLFWEISEEIIPHRIYGYILNAIFLTLSIFISLFINYNVSKFVSLQNHNVFCILLINISAYSFLFSIQTVIIHFLSYFLFKLNIRV